MFTKTEYDVILDNYIKVMDNMVDKYDFGCAFYLAHYPTINKLVGLPADFCVPIAIWDDFTADEALGSASIGSDYFGVYIAHKVCGTPLSKATLARVVVHEFRHIYQYMYWDDFDFNKERLKPWKERRQEIDARSYESKVTQDNFIKIANEVIEFMWNGKLPF